MEKAGKAGKHIVFQWGNLWEKLEKLEKLETHGFSMG